MDYRSFDAELCRLPSAGCLHEINLSCRSLNLCVSSAFVESLSNDCILVVLQGLYFVSGRTVVASLLLRRCSRLALPCQRPPPLEDIYCLLRRAALLLLLTVDAGDSCGETDRDREYRVEGSVAQCQHNYSCCEREAAYFEMMYIFGR